LLWDSPDGVLTGIEHYKLLLLLCCCCFSVAAAVLLLFQDPLDVVLY
jgi:hypothetical protein